LLKVTVIGGGSTYTPELIKGFIERQEEFPLDELWLMDIDPERLKIVGNYVQRIIRAKDAKFNVVLSTDRHQSIQGASYVITQFRVGKMDARRNDEYLGKRHVLIGQETTGIGGMAKALRTIPIILDVAHDIQTISPNALLVNFTNPAGLITEALFRYASDVESVGVCNASITTKMEILDGLKESFGLELKPQDTSLSALGLNHLTWFYGLENLGKDYWPQVMQMLIKDAKKQDQPDFDSHTLENLQMLPNSYLRYYYYSERMLKKQENWPPSRAEEVQIIETDLLDKYKNKRQTEIPKEIMKRGGAYYSTIATQLINAHYNDLNETHIVNTRNNGAVPNWGNDWVLELPCKINASGISPNFAKPLPLVCEGLLTQVKSYEILTAKAAVSGDRQAAYQALLAHPLGPPADETQ